MNEELRRALEEVSDELPTDYRPVVLLCLGIVLVVVSFMGYWTIQALS